MSRSRSAATSRSATSSRHGRSPRARSFSSTVARSARPRRPSRPASTCTRTTSRATTCRPTRCRHSQPMLQGYLRRTAARASAASSPGRARMRRAIEPGRHRPPTTKEAAHEHQCISAEHFQQFSQYVAGLQQQGAIQSARSRLILDSHGGKKIMFSRGNQPKAFIFRRRCSSFSISTKRRSERILPDPRRQRQARCLAVEPRLGDAHDARRAASAGVRARPRRDGRAGRGADGTLDQDHSGVNAGAVAARCDPSAERALQHADDVDRLARGAAAREIGNLVPAARPVGDDERVRRRRAHGRQQRQLGHPDRHVVVRGVVAEAARHPAAARLDQLDGETRDEAQHRLASRSPRRTPSDGSARAAARASAAARRAEARGARRDARAPGTPRSGTRCPRGAARHRPGPSPGTRPAATAGTTARARRSRRRARHAAAARRRRGALRSSPRRRGRRRDRSGRSTAVATAPRRRHPPARPARGSRRRAAR